MQWASLSFSAISAIISRFYSKVCPHTKDAELEAASPSKDAKKSKEFRRNHTVYGELISQMILKCSVLFFTLMWRNAPTFLESRRYFTIKDKGNWQH